MIIAIDGPAGSGKSSTAKAVASSLGITYLDTGAMYRAITLKCLREGIKASEDQKLSDLMKRTSIRFTGVIPDVHVWLDDEDVSTEIRNDLVTKNVSDFCAPLVVREALVDEQRKIGQAGSIVCDGRDIGTVVFPKADLKFFMVASVEERAKRRQKDFEKIGEKISLESIMRDLEERDRKDSTRANSPLRKAEDAIEIDTTSMSFNDQVAFIIEKANALNCKSM